MIIEDGDGTSLKAKVDDDHRLLAKSTTEQNIAHASDVYRSAYDFSTGGFISITSADTETGVFYFKNTEATMDFFVHSLRTCATQIHKIQLYKNPTGGTLITDETDAVSTNLNFNSSNTATSLYYKGAEGKTISGGSVMTQHINNIGHSVILFDDAFIVGPGQSFGLTFELAAAGDCCVRMIGFYN